MYVYETSWKYLNVETIDPKTNNRYRNREYYTEFDGLYVLSHVDMQYPYDDEVKLIRPPSVSSAVCEEPAFVVVDAKRFDRKELEDKLEKIKVFQRYIERAKYFDLNTTLEYQEKVDVYRLQNMGTVIHWFCLEPVIPIKSDHSIFVSCIVPSDTGYTINDNGDTYS